LVVDPPGPPARPWLTVILDDRSRAVPGYALNLTARSALQTALALRQVIWRKTDPAWRGFGVARTGALSHRASGAQSNLSHHPDQVVEEVLLNDLAVIPARHRAEVDLDRLARRRDLIAVRPQHRSGHRAGDSSH